MSAFSVIGICVLVLLAALGCCPSLFSLPLMLYMRKNRTPHRPDCFRSAVVLHLISLTFFASLVFLFLTAPSPGGLGSLGLPLYVLFAIACWTLNGAANSRENLAFQRPRLNA